MRKAIFFCSVSILLLSCGKDFLELGDGTYIPRDLQITRIMRGAEVNTTFDYNTRGLLFKTTIYTTGNVVSSEQIYRYNDEGMPVKIETMSNVSSSSVPQYVHGYQEILYDANKKLSETKTYRLENGSFVYVSRAVPDFDAQGRTVATTIYAMPANTAVSKTTYEYNAQFNIVKSEVYQFSMGTSPTMSYTYEHDNKNNPLRSKWVFPFGANYNNISKQVYTNHIVAPGISNTPVTTQTIFKTYNKDGFPTLVSDGGVDYVYEYQ